VLQPWQKEHQIPTILHNYYAKALKALHDTKAALLKTNYDDILDKYCGLLSFDTSLPKHAQDFRAGTDGVFHIYGRCKNSEAVVLDITDYFAVQQSETVRELMRNLLSITVLFVGCGEGVHDPSFHALLK
jgi:SIR2-like domain